MMVSLEFLGKNEIHSVWFYKKHCKISTSLCFLFFQVFQLVLFLICFLFLQWVLSKRYWIKVFECQILMYEIKISYSYGSWVEEEGNHCDVKSDRMQRCILGLWNSLFRLHTTHSEPKSIIWHENISGLWNIV